MTKDTRTTVYLKPKIYRALKVKAASTSRSISELINLAVQEALKEDALDLEACERRSKESSRQFEAVLERLRHEGLV